MGVGGRSRHEGRRVVGGKRNVLMTNAEEEEEEEEGDRDEAARFSDFSIVC